MAQSIKNLSLGVKIKDSKDNKFILIAKNHYGQNEVTLLSEDTYRKRLSPSPSQDLNYPYTEVEYYLKNDYPRILDSQLASNVVLSTIPYYDCISVSQYDFKTHQCKYFILSAKELGANVTGVTSFPKENIMSYMNQNRREIYSTKTWTRTETKQTAGFSLYVNVCDEYTYSTSINAYNDIRPSFNLIDSILVSDNVENGYYSFVFNQPPTIQTISNIKGNYGTPTTIEYTATDADDSQLNHYFSKDNGSTWEVIKPSRVGNRYSFGYLFKELADYNCRIKVVDGSDNETTSNMFLVGINSIAPSVNIVSVIDRVVTFKVSCVTDVVTKVEILINGAVKRTITSGFDFNLTHEINRADLNIGVNAIQIKATSSVNLVGTRGLEANKKAYNLPPAGTKVIIDNQNYSIVSATQNGTNQTYTLNRNLVSNVSVGSLIQVLQDYINVKCALSNTSTDKDYKNMKLVKTKSLKGAFDGYVEEKYELDGEGRYSTVMLEMERFNNDVASEIKELQQAFDYLED